MKAFCTYCSGRKSMAPGLIPAIKRYESPRILAIHDMAQQAGAHFLILSGKYGLIRPGERIPFYDHLLSMDEVEEKSRLVCEQLRSLQVLRLFYYTASIELEQTVAPYHHILSKACRRERVELTIELIPRADHKTQ